MQTGKLKSFFGLVVIVALLIPIHSASSASVQAAEVLTPLKIVQLGDSYSAGNGARSDTGERNYSGVEGCYRSPTNWGNQYANSLRGSYAVTYVNRACSGATTANIQGIRDIEDYDPCIVNCPPVKYPNEEYYDPDNPFFYDRLLYPQIDAIDESVDLVLMTMGGNDLGFATIVANCFTHFRTPALCRWAIQSADSLLPRLRGDLTDNFVAIIDRLRPDLNPDARIAYVSYPQLLPPETVYELEFWSPTTPSVLLDSYDAGVALRKLSADGEIAQRNAVTAANEHTRLQYGIENFIVFYEDTDELFENHEPDPSPTSRNPKRWMHEFETIIPVEWYHPNPLGHQNWAAALAPFGSFGAGGGSFGTRVDMDVAFVVDTTGSMGDEIAQVQADLSSLVDQLAATTDSYRVAVVSYRDFPARTGDYRDYPFQVIQTFTDDPVVIQAAIDSLTLGYGGDDPETVFSGLRAAIELPWRPGVTKVAMVIGDAPALSPEPITNLTVDEIIAQSIAVDPVQVVGVDTGTLNSNGAVGQIAEATNGSVVLGTSGLTTVMSDILDSAAKQPFAWAGQAYSGMIGQPVLFDASGSYDPSGTPITLYEWDFDGDGFFDLWTDSPTITHIYEAAFDDFVVLRVTGQGGTALASARTVVNAEGFAPQGDEQSCQLDENGYSIVVDAEGRFLPCTADSLPPTDPEGVTEVSGPLFADVPDNHWARSFIDRLYNSGITSGCGTNPLKYCPEQSVTRAQMAVFLERGIHGSAYAPPAVGGWTGFGDVAPNHWAATFIKQLALEGITAGCGSGNYCPEAPVTRAQMAVFLLRSKYGGAYLPPSAGIGTGFGDVPAGHWAAAFIKQLVAEGITVGCGGGNYCPEAPVTRAQMAVFLVRTFNLP